MKRSILALLLLAVLLPAQAALAQTPSPQPSPTSIDVPSLLSNITLDVGTGYDTKNKQWVETDTARFLEYKVTTNAGKYAAFLNFVGQMDPSANIGYSTNDKLVVGLAFNLVSPSMFGITSPLLQYVAVRPFVEYSFYHIGSNVTNIKNSWIFGATFIQGKF